MLIMELFEEIQLWWRSMRVNHCNRAAEEEFLGRSSMDDGSVDGPFEKDALQSSQRSRFRLCNHLCWLTLANALILGVTVVVIQSGTITAAMSNCIKATSSYCIFSLFQECFASISDLISSADNRVQTYQFPPRTV